MLLCCCLCLFVFCSFAVCHLLTVSLEYRAWSMDDSSASRDITSILVSGPKHFIVLYRLLPLPPCQPANACKVWRMAYGRNGRSPGIRRPLVGGPKHSTRSGLTPGISISWPRYSCESGETFGDAAR